MAKTNGKGKQRAGELVVDLHRAFVFPNRMREQRRRHGYPKLLRLASRIPEIPYIRLSKIERGEVVARADELRRIAAALEIAPAELLIDIDAPDFDIAQWAEPFDDGADVDLDEERFAVLLGAALRARRTRDPALTIAAIERDFGLPPVNLSRIENAQKPFARWNPATQKSLFAIFGVAREADLRSMVEAQHRSGALDDFLAAIANPEARHERSRQRIAEIRAALAAEDGISPPPAAPPVATEPLALLVPRGSPAAAVRLIPVYGAPLPHGLIAHQETGETVEAPRVAGARSFALKVCRATLGGGLPGQATVVADPDRFPSPGGLVALREEGGWRLLSVASDREGRMIGYSVNPDMEVPLDGCDPADLAAIVSAIFV